MKRILAIFGMAAALLVVSRIACADTCYETPTTNIDCSPKKPASQKPTAQKPPADPNSLREKLRRSLNTPDERPSSDTAGKPATGERSTGRPAPSPADTTAPAAAEAPAPAGPANIAVVNGYVFVCDGPVDAAHATCREIQHDGRQCIAVTADEGVMGWRDSIDTPCSADDLAQRDAYLASHREEAGIVSAAAMSNECRDLALNYVAAAEASNGESARAAYEAMQRAGGCGVLSKLEPQSAPAPDPRFVSRSATPMLDQTVVPCDQQPGACAAVVNQLRAGTSPEAVAALYSNAIAIGLELGAAMGQIVLSAQQMTMINATRVSAPRMGPAPVRMTRGSTGRTIYRPPPAVPGCRIGGVGWCTAQ